MKNAHSTPQTQNTLLSLSAAEVETLKLLVGETIEATTGITPAPFPGLDQLMIKLLVAGDVLDGINQTDPAFLPGAPCMAVG